ncbi:aspartate kinase [Hathewaya proteolytica DSM 3090]|uniref:Aspartokinase n=1 Tax=Hathewaya proteolytica DSM 3090 TaxID=1121331 RepID=A0A1M6J4S4_9CLOT|nr:aspartate kinase [Hathewaya proteolytica]SHJ41708.1 aspartate kinase [Hathewaya proteolytica DSM 3090]
MKIIVQKFGGTSVSTNDKREKIVEKIKKAIKDGYSPLIVVSAMGRMGEPYATDTLRSMIDNRFRESNLQATDMLISCGETISTIVMSNKLYEHNMESMPLTGGQAGILTNSDFGNAEILDVNTDRILSLLKQNIIPVVAGFQGVDKHGYITTLGRGASDVTAAVLGAYLKAEKVEIYTDVDGIMTTDPRIVEKASLINKIDYAETCELAEQGAKVIHPRAVQIAQKYNIPLIIKNTMSECEGTTIGSFDDTHYTKPVTGIAYLNDRVQFHVKSSNENYFKLFDSFAENLISLDLINVFPKEKIFTVDAINMGKVKTILEEYNLEYTITEHCSKISIIGMGMKGRPGVMAKILTALTRVNIEVLQTADSHMTIWCLVKEEEVNDAIRSLHKEFNL